MTTGVKTNSNNVLLIEKKDSMVDIIAYNKECWWYLGNFVYEYSFIKLQYLMLLFMWAQSKDSATSPVPHPVNHQLPISSLTEIILYNLNLICIIKTS